MKEVALQISSFTRAGQEQTRSKSHILTGSEPEVLLGSDSGPNAIELVLAARWAFATRSASSTTRLSAVNSKRSPAKSRAILIYATSSASMPAPPRLHRDSRQRPCPRQERLPGGSRQALPVRP